MKSQTPMLANQIKKAEHPPAMNSQSKRKKRPQMDKNDPSLIFKYYDTENMRELNTEQLRKYFACEEHLYLSQEDVKKVLSEMMHYSFRLPLSDFGQLREYIKANRQALEEKSNANNQYSLMFEAQLTREQDQIPNGSNIFAEKDMQIVVRNSAEEKRKKYLKEISEAKSDSIIRLMYDVIFSQSYEIKPKEVKIKMPSEFVEKYQKTTFDKSVSKKVDISYLSTQHSVLQLPSMASSADNKNEQSQATPVKDQEKIKDRRTLREPLFDMMRTQIEVAKGFDSTQKNATQEEAKTVRMVLQINNINPGKSKVQIEPLYGFFAILCL